ncbi:MAG: hypothetical protein M3524_13485 [Actinomycetota bacterium]|nr:hypothetical protein [Actinomycetota bacterium]
MGGTETRQWYWCLEHGKAEPAGQCRAEQQMGPYDSPAQAARWRERVSDRNDTWDASDERWEGREKGA